MCLQPGKNSVNSCKAAAMFEAPSAVTKPTCLEMGIYQTINLELTNLACYPCSISERNKSFPNILTTMLTREWRKSDY